MLAAIVPSATKPPACSKSSEEREVPFARQSRQSEASEGQRRDDASGRDDVRGAVVRRDVEQGQEDDRLGGHVESQAQVLRVRPPPRILAHLSASQETAMKTPRTRSHEKPPTMLLDQRFGPGPLQQVRFEGHEGQHGRRPGGRRFGGWNALRALVSA